MNRPFGFHIAGGSQLGSSLLSAVNAKYTAAQIFLGPPQTPRVSSISKEEFELFRKLKADTGIKVYVHAPYVLHVFSKPENKKKNDHAIAKIWEMANSLGVDGLVLHMGGTKHYVGGIQEYIELASQMLDVIFPSDYRTGKEVPQILFENCANGNEMSGHLDTICSLLDALVNRGYPVGLCLDTLHAWAWGYDYRDPVMFSRVVDDLVFKHLKLIHLNSAPEKVVCGGKYDRHESIGKGIIPEEHFVSLLRSLPGIPVVAERENVLDVIEDWKVVKKADEKSRMSLIEQGE